MVHAIIATGLQHRLRAIRPTLLKYLAEKDSVIRYTRSLRAASASERDIPDGFDNFQDWDNDWGNWDQYWNNWENIPSN